MFVNAVKKYSSIILPGIENKSGQKSTVTLEQVNEAYKSPQFSILDTPILSLWRSVNYVEQKEKGNDISKPLRDPIIQSGMPGSSCQMHQQITNEIMKNLKRKKSIDQSLSQMINKWRFKLP